MAVLRLLPKLFSCNSTPQLKALLSTLQPASVLVYCICKWVRGIAQCIQTSDVGLFVVSELDDLLQEVPALVCC